MRYLFNFKISSVVQDITAIVNNFFEKESSMQQMYRFIHKTLLSRKMAKCKGEHSFGAMNCYHLLSTCYVQVTGWYASPILYHVILTASI